MKHDIIYYDDLSWVKPTRQQLLAEWVCTWNLHAGIIEPCKCTSLFCDVVNLDDGHISIACSVANEYQQVTDLLHSEGFDRNPILFFRLYLYLLDEFTSRIQEATELIAGMKPRQPTRISIWANRYAKHKASIFIMHHAMHVFADGHESMYTLLEKTEGEIDGMCLRTDILPETLVVLNEKWFMKNERPNLVLGNIARKNIIPAIAIPPLRVFLQEAIDYFVKFVTEARKHPDKLKQFQSQYHWPITPQTEAEIMKMIYGKEI